VVSYRLCIIGSFILKYRCKKIAASLRRSRPDFMVSSHIVILDKWPLTPHGKVDRKKLPQPVTQSGQDYVAPETDTEIRLANIWCDVLNIEKVGVFDNFFDLGGHSLLAARVISKLRKEFSVEISLRVLFEMRTVSDISRYIDRINWAVQSQTHGNTFHEVRISLKDGFMTSIDKIYRDYENYTLNVGHVPEFGGMSVRIVELTDDLRPKTVDFIFDQALDDPDLIWLIYNEDDEFVEFSAPSIGETVPLKV